MVGSAATREEDILGGYRVRSLPAWPAA